MRTFLKKLTTALILISISLMLLNGCNTVAGFGQDVKNTGQGIKNAASG